MDAPPVERANHRTVISLALATLVIHFLANGRYGYFRDELYAIACSKHLAWGYVDQPPFSELMLAINGHLLGYSLFALRFMPAVCGALVAFLVGLIAREMGGGRFAQVLAVVAYIIGVVYLVIDNFYSMNCFDHFFWALAIYLLVRILKGGDTRLWVWFGLVAGLGLENKYSMAFLGAGVIVGLALTPARRHFLDKWLWVGGALATVIFLPHVVWEVRNHFPTREFIHNVTYLKNLPMTPWRFLTESALQVHPFTLPIWLAGLIYLGGWRRAKLGPENSADPRLAQSEARRLPHTPGNAELRSAAAADADSNFRGASTRKYRTLGWAFLVALAILLSTRAKPYYLAPAFLILLPAGGVAVEAFLNRHQWKWAKPAYLTLLVLGGALTAPLGLPVLPVETFIRYEAWIGIKPRVDERGENLNKLPQIYADMFGWQEMTQQMADIYNHLSPEEKSDCVIGASNYGAAGAIDFFGKQYGLPNAISSHNNYWIWGPGDKPGKVLLVIGGSKKGYERTYSDVQEVGIFENPYARESGTRIFLCRRPKETLQEIWPRIKNFI